MTIDPHQKTILSDEISVGFIGYVLMRRIGFTFVGDTNYVANVIQPGTIKLRQPARRGPAKSPDFIFVDHRGRIHVVECKGSQAGWRPLRRAMTSGQVQKANAAVVAPARGSSMVVGLLLAQWNSREESRMHFIDPPMKHVFADLQNVSPRIVRMAVIQICLAKHFALLGLTRAVGRLAATPVSELSGLGLEEITEEVGDLPMVDDDIVRDADQRSTDSEGRLVVDRFAIRCNRRRLLAFSGRGAVFGFISRLADAPGSVRWRFARDGQTGRIETPLGFVLEMSTVSR